MNEPRQARVLCPYVFCCSLLAQKTLGCYARGAAHKAPSAGFNLHTCTGVKAHSEALACAGGEFLMPETIA